MICMPIPIEKEDKNFPSQVPFHNTYLFGVFYILNYPFILNIKKTLNFFFQFYLYIDYMFMNAVSKNINKNCNGNIRIVLKIYFYFYFYENNLLSFLIS